MASLQQKNRENKTSAFAPATVANLACGFDVIGLALETIGDTVTLRISDKPGIVIKSITGDGGKLPKEPEKNTATIAIREFMEELGTEYGLEVDIQKGIPLASGLGSSAASAAAAIFACNELFGSPFTKEELLPFALESEKQMTGAAHADNIAPSLFGGVALIRDREIMSLPYPEDLIIIVAHPHFELNTKESRKALPEAISLEKAIKQWSHLASLTLGFCMQNTPLIGRSLKDHVIEEFRGPLIPGFGAVKNAALDAGALGCSISGAGPSLFALSDSLPAARTIGESMKKAFKKEGADADIICSKINPAGSKLL